MARSFSFWQFAGFVFTSVMGTVLHFVYDVSGQQTAVGLFAAVNESTWEHMKLLFFPMVIFALIQWCILGKEREDYWCIMSRGIWLGVWLIPVLFYTYSGVFGVNVDAVNVTIFFVSAAVSYVYQAVKFKHSTDVCVHPMIAVAAVVGLAIMFWVFTFFPPRIPLFEDPVKNVFGILQN